MGKKDPRVDAYIAKSADFAKPILRHLRRLVHAGCPDVEETLKWSMPSFMHHGILCGMAAFKQHCTFGFWHSGMNAEMKDIAVEQRGMGQLGRITSLAQLPKDALFKKLVRQAALLNESGEKPKRAAKKKAPQKLVVPADLAKALAKCKPAKATFDAFSYSNRKEYVEWITEAKREETRARRLATAIEWLAEGKSRNWKYEKC